MYTLNQPQHNYKHSSSFAVLKGTQETFDGNLSTVQYMRILDGYLYRSLAPIVNCTNHADKCITHLLAWGVRHGKRKLTMDATIDYQALMFQFLMTPREPKYQGTDASPMSQRLRLLKSIKFDRAFLLYIVNSFVNNLAGTYSLACNGNLTAPFGSVGDNLSFNLYVKNRIDQYYGVPKSISLLEQHQVSTFWRDRHLSAKKIILEKYVRLTIQSAQKDYAHYFYCTNVDLDDLCQSYLMMTSRAIDRCDPDQGTLTTLIQSWHLTGRSNAQKDRDRLQHEDRNVTAEDLDDLDETAVFDAKDDEHQHEVNHIRRIAELADPKGFGRFLLGLLSAPPSTHDREVLEAIESR